jgi:hypothetical protein
MKEYKSERSHGIRSLHTKPCKVTSHSDGNGRSSLATVTDQHAESTRRTCVGIIPAPK